MLHADIQVNQLNQTESEKPVKVKTQTQDMYRPMLCIQLIELNYVLWLVASNS